MKPAQLRLIGSMAQDIFAKAPPSARAVYRAAMARRPKGPIVQKGRRAPAADLEARFLAKAGAVRVPELQIAAPLISAARNASVRAAAELRTTVPIVRWFRNITGNRPDARGWFCASFADCIWLSSGLSVQEVRSTARHEAQHRDDSLHGRPMNEERADAFAARFDQPSDPRMWAPQPTTFLHPPAGVWT